MSQNKKKYGPYLTKRVLESVTKKAIKKASDRAMELNGYVVIAEDGWIIKKYKDGTIEKIHQIK